MHLTNPCLKMALALILAFYSLVHFTLLGISFQKGIKADLALWFLRLMLFGMFYDNLILASSSLIGQASIYETLNFPRYVLHAVVLPFLVPFTLWTMQRSEIPLAQNKLLLGFCGTFTIAAIAYGLIVDVLPLKLIWSECLGHQRLVSASTLPPLATILTNLLIIPGAYLLWRKTQSTWLLIGAVSIFIVNSAFITFQWGFIAGNGAEVIFILCLLKTYEKLEQISPSQRAENPLK